MFNMCVCVCVGLSITACAMCIDAFVVLCLFQFSAFMGMVYVCVCFLRNCMILFSRVCNFLCIAISVSEPEYVCLCL